MDHMRGDPQPHAFTHLRDGLHESQRMAPHVAPQPRCYGDAHAPRSRSYGDADTWVGAAPRAAHETAPADKAGGNLRGTGASLVALHLATVR